MNKDIKNQFDRLLAFSEDEELDHKAQMLAFQFLGKVDRTMAERGMSKKVLAERVGTSASFITQLFRGDRKPNWNILAKMQQELDLQFKVITEKELQELLQNSIIRYHRSWEKSRAYEKEKGLDPMNDVIMHIEENEYRALAG